VLRELDAALAGVRAAHPGLRWTAPGQWHVTLAFHGDDADVDARIDALARVAHLPAPRLELGAFGSFPSGVLWVGVAGDLDALRAVALAAGADPDRWHPHLTVARWRGRTPPQVVARPPVGAGWTAREAVLVRSDAGPGGHAYTQVATVPLDASASG
jgi:2'-5' RNA ligase